MSGVTRQRSIQAVSARRFLSGGRSPLPPTPRIPPPASVAREAAKPRRTTPLPIQKSSAGTGHPGGAAASNFYGVSKNRTPVSWTSLFLVAVTAASAVAYYRIERERRMEELLGKVVSSESDGWTPRPDYLARRKFVQTAEGTWLPRDDGWGARTSWKAVVWLSGLAWCAESLTHCVFSVSPLFIFPSFAS